jgi:hypothetical protein
LPAIRPSAGVTDIKGTLVVVDGERSLKLGRKLSLQMDDGRTASFITETGHAASGTYGIHVNELSGRR